MSDEGAGDRHGLLFAFRAGDDRPVPTSNIRAVQACLIGLDVKRVAIVTMVVADDLPLVVMFNGDPFIRHELEETGGVLLYRQVRAYRADAMVIEDARENPNS